MYVESPTKYPTFVCQSLSVTLYIYAVFFLILMVFFDTFVKIY